MRTTALFIALSPLCLTFGQPPDRPGGMMRPNPAFAALDTDHDGAISAAELAGATAALKTLDKNGDGQLTRDELMPGMERREPGSTPADGIASSLMQFDKNGDGKLAKDELPERMQAMVDRGDKNKDGFLTAEEITAMSGSPRGEAGGEGRRGGGPMGGMNPLMNALDSDKDGVISEEELKGASVALKALDKNADGVLTADEVRPVGGPGGRGGRGFDPAQMAGRMLEQFDKDGDGKLSKDELPEQMRDRMSTADTNKDGFLSKEELQQIPGGMRRRQE